MSGEFFVFTAGTNIAHALELDPRVEAAFRELGLKCAGRGPGGEWCVATEKETIADAAVYHEADLERILAALNGLRIPKKAS